MNALYRQSESLWLVAWCTTSLCFPVNVTLETESNLYQG
jgi:hypothetical protein